MTVKAGVGVEGFSQSTRERMASTERAKVPANPRLAIANAFEKAHDRRRAEDRAAEQRQIDVERARKLKDQAQADRRRKLQALAAEELALDAMFELHGASKEEITKVNNLMAGSGRFGNVDAHWAALMQIRAEG
jgi:hypothetical protein